MCAAKTSKRPGLERVARHLYRRGNSYEFRRVIPPRARHLFEGVATYSRSFGDVTRREADHLSAEHRKHCDKLIARASNAPDPTARAVALRFSTQIPAFDEIDRAIRAWVTEQEQQASGVADRAAAKQMVRDMSAVAQFTPVHQREDRQGSLLATSWIADALATSNRWSLADDGPERRYLIDRVGRAQREVAIRIGAELNYEDRPRPTHAMFDPTAFERDRTQPTSATVASIPIMGVFDRYAAEQQPAPKTVKKWKAALRSLIDHLGHDDTTKVTSDDIVGWKDELLALSSDGLRARGHVCL